ncbi:MAG TPA: hypothetical protein VM118_06165 [Acidobacteriota bacterium]|nr:hypothetical protein [Acidobacteriota bacterium]
MGYVRTIRHRSKRWAMGGALLIAAVCAIAVQQVASGNTDPKPSPLFEHSLRTSVENFDRHGATPRTRVAPQAAAAVPQMVRPVAGNGDDGLYRRPLYTGPQGAARGPEEVRAKPSADALQRITDEPVTAVQASVPLMAPGTFCDGEWQSGPAYFFTNWFEGNETYAVYQDPDQLLANSFGSCAPPPPSNYVFAVTEIHWYVVPQSPVTIVFQPLVFDADLSNPACPIPGAVLCDGPLLEIDFPVSGVYVLNLPFAVDCCPFDPFFAAVYVPTYLGPESMGIVIDDGVTPPPIDCRAYNDYGTGWLDLVDNVGFPGNLELFSEGYSRAEAVSQSVAAVALPDPIEQALQSDQVVVQSIVAVPGQTDVTVEISIENMNDIRTLALPFIARSLSGSAFWEGPVDTLSGYGRLTSAMTETRAFYTDVPVTPTQVMLGYWDMNSVCLAAGPLEGMTGLVFDVNFNLGEFEIDTAFYAPATPFAFVECGASQTLTPAFTKGTVTIEHPVATIVTMAGTASCTPVLTCGGNTCPGSGTCPGTVTCSPLASCAIATCAGTGTCAPMLTCTGVATCSGSITCFPATTCAGMSTCDSLPTLQGMPGCPFWHTLPAPDCDWPTIQGTPTCGVFTCPDWPTCGVACPTIILCATYDVPTQCGAYTCGQYPTCGDYGFTCYEDWVCIDIVATIPGQVECETAVCNAAALHPEVTPTPAPGTPLVAESARRLPPDYPVVYSVDGPENPAEGLLQPDPLYPGSGGHPPPNDVFAVRQRVRGYHTEGELFQSSGWLLGQPPDLTNVDRMSGALGFAQATGGPYVGPFAPNPGATNPEMPMPCRGGRTLGIMPGDNVNALSFGLDGGNVLLFSVGPGAVGLPTTDVYYEANLSPTAGPMGTSSPSNGGGDPGSEAAGDLYVSGWFSIFGDVSGQITLAPALPNLNQLAIDEVLLGLQAPAIAYGIAPEEDDLDALEADDGLRVDADVDGVPDVFQPVYLSLNPVSTTVTRPTPDPFPWMGTALDPDGVTPDDILMSPPPMGPTMTFAIYARGVRDIGLLPGDDLDALCLYENGDRILSPGADQALFSLAMGSPSLAAGANPNMPGPGPFSPGDVFMTEFPGQYGQIYLYAPAAALGLEFNDELDALDIGGCECDYDTDFSLVGDICEIGYTHWGSTISVVLADYLRVTYDLVYRPGRTLYSIVYPGPPPPVGYTVVPVPPVTQTTTEAAAPTPPLLSAASQTTAFAYNVGTNAGYAGPVTVCFGYDENQLTGPEAGVRLLQYREVAPGDTQWVDVTISVDLEANEVCGEVDVLKTYFLVAESSCNCVCQGDPICDGVMNVLDVVQAVNEAFRGAPSLVDPTCPHAPAGRSDVNCDGVVNVLDVVFLVNWAFRGNAWAPCDPCLCTPYPTDCIFPPE